MVALRDRSVALFDYTGCILNLRYKSNGSIKAIEMAHESKRLHIKLDKALRRSLRIDLLPGMTIRVAGYCKYDKYGFPILRGDHLWTLTMPPQSSACQPDPTQPTTRLEGQPEHCSVGHAATAPSGTAPASEPEKPTEATILVCRKSSCKKRGSLAICAAIESAISERDHAGKVNVKQVGCLKRCKAGPNLVFLPDKTRYSDVNPKDVPSLLDQHLG